MKTARLERPPDNWIELRRVSTYYEFRNEYNLSWRVGAYISLEEAKNYYIVGGYKEVAMKHDPNDLQIAACCNAGVGTNSSAIWDGKKWHDINCGEYKKKQQIDMDQMELDLDEIFGSAVPPVKVKKCTCGSASLGSDRHSDYCDIK